MKSLKQLCNAYNKLKKTKADPNYLKFGVNIMEDLYRKLGIGDPCKPLDISKKRKKGKTIIGSLIAAELSPERQAAKKILSSPDDRTVIFDSSPYESTRCMNNTQFNKLEARIITTMRDRLKDEELMMKVLRIFEMECKELTPMNTGLLVNSLYTYVEFSNDEVIGVIGYDISVVFKTTKSGERVYYALAVHNREANHYSPPRATWRFLEIAFENQYIRSIAREILK